MLNSLIRNEPRGRIRGLPKLKGKIEKEEFRRAWIFILPGHEESKYSPVQSIPLLTENFSGEQEKIRIKD
jgi:hypothetical protein